MILICDGKKDLHIAQNLGFHEHVKYFEVDCPFVLERLIDNVILRIIDDNNGKLIWFSHLWVTHR